MALSNRINMRISGGTLGKYLYKNGVDNTALTGGLTNAGYTFHSSLSEAGTLSFEQTHILMSTSSTNERYKMFGTAPLINLDDINSVIMKYDDAGNTQQIALDTSNLTGNYYLFFAIYRTSSINYVDVGAATTKTNVLNSTGHVYTEIAGGSTSISITEISYT